MANKDLRELYQNLLLGLSVQFDEDPRFSEEWRKAWNETAKERTAEQEAVKERALSYDESRGLWRCPHCQGVGRLRQSVVVHRGDCVLVRSVMKETLGAVRRFLALPRSKEVDRPVRASQRSLACSAGAAAGYRPGPGGRSRPDRRQHFRLRQMNEKEARSSTGERRSAP